MNYRKSILLLMLVICLFSITSVCASEIDNSIAREDTSQMGLSDSNKIIEDDLQTSEENTKLTVDENDETLNSEIDSEILTANQFTYSNLREQIGSGGNINLTKGTYTYNNGDGDTIQISTSGVIDGNGAVIDMKESTIRAFTVSASGVTIKNLTIKNAIYEGDGGAIYFSSSGTVSNCNFTDNRAGNDGGAICFNSSGTVSNCNFTNNQAYINAGAIKFVGDGNVTNCNFNNNFIHQYNGGAIYFAQSGRVTNCTFTNNQGLNRLSHAGAIMFLYNGNVTNCSFVNNQAHLGSAICFYNDLGPMLSITISNCNFVNNTASDSGTVYLAYNNTVSNCNFTNNRVGFSGGTIYSIQSGRVTNCNFINNSANYSGAVYFYGGGNASNCNFTGNTANNGGAVYFSGTGTVSNCNFTGNNATTGSAIYFYKWNSLDTLTVSNSTFLNNRANAESLDVVKNDNNITITFTGQNNLLNAIYSREDAEVAFYNVTYWGANGITTVSNTMSGSNKATGQNITVGVVVNNELVLSDVRVTNESGMIVLDISAGENYYISARHDTDSYYTEAEKTISNNTKFNVNVTSQTTTNKTVNITAKSNIPNDVVQGKLLFILPNRTQIEATYGANGTWWAVHEFDKYDVYQVNATYVGLDNVTINNGTITINKVNSTIILDNIVLDYGETKNVTVTTTGSTGITAKIDGNNVTVINNYTIQIPVLDAGTYNLTVTTIPDDDYNPVTKEVNITVNKVNSTLTVSDIVFGYGSSGSTVVSLAGAYGVNATVVGQPKTVVKVNGTNITVSDLDAGTYTLTVTAIADKNHNNITKNATITVNKVNATLTVNDVVLDYGESKNITVAAEGATGITAKIDGVDVTVSNYTIPISGLGAGNYTLTVTTIPDDNHNPVTKESTIIVNKLSTEIILANETLDLKVGDEVPVLVNLTPAGAGNLTFTSSDEDLVFVEDNVTIVANSQGQAIITVSFAGNENYTAAENKTITVNVALNDASVSVENDTLNLKVDETYAINATIKPDTIMIHIKYTSSNESVATVDKNGIVTAVGEGTAIITLEVGDNEIYAKNSTTVTVNVKDNTVNVSASDLTKYYNGPESFVVIVTDSRNNPLANQSVIINVAGVNYTRTTDANGTASIAISLISGQYNVTTIVGNNTVYSTVTVLPTVNATDLVKVFRNATQFYATFKDSKGNYLADGTMVRFNINGVMYDRKISGNNGLAKLNINLEQGQYIITSMNLETGENAANNVTVISRLIENKELVKYYRNATQYTVKVIGDNGNAVGAGEIVTFNVNGVLYNRTTNESGIVKLNINLHPGDYIITAEYKDCRVSNNIKVLPVLTADDLTKKYGTPDQFIATLVGGQGNPFAGETVQFNVNGIFYNRVTDSNGQSKLNIRLMPGKYVITSSYNGTNIANTITISA